jgi:hypothetical protein
MPLIFTDDVLKISQFRGGSLRFPVAPFLICVMPIFHAHPIIIEPDMTCKNQLRQENKAEFFPGSIQATALSVSAIEFQPADFLFYSNVFDTVHSGW